MKLNLPVSLRSKRRIALGKAGRAHADENGVCEAQARQHESLIRCEYKVLAVKISEGIEQESAEDYRRTVSESEIVQECCDCSTEILSCARTEAE